jgi:murein DD-endopeptidase MepM/ murein hydrolase activator NlpD
MIADAVPPVQPAVIVAAYAPAAHNWQPAHRGVDFAASESTEVLAVRSGTVVLSRMIAGRPVLVLRSRGVRFTHEPVIGTVAVGEHVRTGEVIGVMGVGGHCATVCLHWGAKVKGSYVDPLSFLPRSAPVLKPVRTGR